MGEQHLKLTVNKDCMIVMGDTGTMATSLIDV